MYSSKHYAEYWCVYIYIYIWLVALPSVKTFTLIVLFILSNAITVKGVETK